MYVRCIIVRDIGELVIRRREGQVARHFREFCHEILAQEGDVNNSLLISYALTEAYP